MENLERDFYQELHSTMEKQDSSWIIQETDPVKGRRVIHLRSDSGYFTEYKVPMSEEYKIEAS